MRFLLCLLLCLAPAAAADPLRLAYFDTELSRRGPALLLRDILKDQDDQLHAVTGVIDAAAPDVLLLAGLDYDAELRALSALNATLARPFPHLFALRPNSGMATGRDMDGNGRLGQARDAQGFGYFSGADGLALLSRRAILSHRDFAPLLWQDLPGSLIAGDDPGIGVQRLSSTAHWQVTLQGGLVLGLFKAGPPVFDGPEDRNGRRNHDEVAFWSHWLAGQFGPVGQSGPVGQVGPVGAPLAILGGANLDPARGEGRRSAITALLANPALQDPLPGRTTVDWSDGPGRMRVDYVLPSAGLAVTGAGMITGDQAARASRHSLIWVDVAP